MTNKHWEILVENTINSNENEEYTFNDGIYSRDVSIIEHVIQTGSQDVNSFDHSGDTPLHKAAIYNEGDSHYAIFNVLLRAGADPNIYNKDGQVPLHILAGNPNLKPRIIKLLSDYNAFPNLPDNRGYTPLHWAVMEGCFNSVKELQYQGADVNAKNASGYTPISLALRRQNLDLDIIQLLLDRKGDPNIRDNFNMSAIDHAKMHGVNPTIINKLLKFKIKTPEIKGYRARAGRRRRI